MLNRIWIVFISVLATMILSLPALAHEYWLQPDTFILPNEGLIQAHIKTGQDFRGNNFAYLPLSVESMQIHLGDKSQPTSSRFGDYPAISEVALGDGLNILSATTTPTKLTYEKPGKFESFLRNEGLDWVLAEHHKRQLPETGFTEIYSRYTKALVKVGSGKGADRKIGHTFEWVLETNPYTNEQNKLVAQLWWQDKILANHQLRYFIQTGKNLTTDIAITDKNGRANIPYKPGSTYMVNAVYMVTPSKENATKYKAVWDSRWASVTFATK